MKFISRLNQRFGKSIRDEVLSDIANARFEKPGRVRLAAQLTAVAISTTPYVVALAGLAVLAFGYPNIPGLLMGALIFAAGIYLRPSARRNTQLTLSEKEAPTLFRLFDEISNHLESPKITGFHLNGEFNAYMAQFGKNERVVGIGAPLWLSFDGAERLAVLAHELAHLANNDPRRYNFTGAAMETLGRWSELFVPPAVIDHESNTRVVIDDRDFIGQIVGGFLGGIISTIEFLYEKLIFAESQRAEYLADSKAATIAGAPAMQSTLKQLILSDLAYERLGKIYYDGRKHVPVFEEMARAVACPEKDRAAKLIGEAAAESHTVEASHPPTRYRLEVVAAIDHSPPKISAAGIDWQQIDKELSSHFEAAERATLSSIIVQ